MPGVAIILCPNSKSTKMKRTLLIAASVLMAGMVQAQDNATAGEHSEHNMWLSGSAQFRSYDDDSDYTESGGNFSPAFGFFLNERMAVGLRFSIEGMKMEENNDGYDEETKMSEFSVNPFFRYYRNISDNCHLFGELSVGFGSGKVETDVEFGPDPEDTYSFFQTSISPGIQYWMHERWSVEAAWGALSYRGYNDKADFDGQSDRTESEIAVGLDLTSLSFGLNFHF